MAVVVGATGAFVAGFGWLILRQHEAYGTHTFDFGIFDQGLWLLSQGASPFVTLRGLDLFADHSSYVMVLLAPLYRVWDDPRALLVGTVVLLASVGPLTYAAGRALGLVPVLAAAMAVAALLYPAIQWATWWTFHPELVAIPVLLVAFLLTVRGHPGWAVVALVVILSVKEDAALVVVPFGLWMILSGRGRRAGLVAAALASAWFVIDVVWLLPHLSPTGELVYAGRYASFGDGLIGALVGIGTRPDVVAQVLGSGDRPLYVVAMLAPLPLALLRPSMLLVALPVTLANLLSSQAGQHDIRFQYGAYLSAVVVMAALLGAQRAQGALGSKRGRQLAGLVLMVAALANIWWSPSPPARHGGAWVAPSPDDAVVADALARIPPDAVVSAGSFLAPHLGHRRTVYLYPNPFSRSYWALDGVALPSSDAVEWIVVRPGDIESGSGLVVIDGLRRSSEWEVVVEAPTVVLLRRR